MCIFGISHLDPYARLKIEDIFEEFSPQLLLLELDHMRFSVLEQLIESRDFNINNPDYKKIKRILNPDIYELETNNMELSIAMKRMRDMQWNLGKRMGSLPLGLEFIISIYFAKEQNIPIYVIDKSTEDINRQLNEISRFERDYYLNANDIDDIAKEYYDLMENIDNLDFINDIQMNFKKNAPNMYKIIIEERDHHMTNEIRRIILRNKQKKILVILGVGHFNGVNTLIEQFLDI